MPWQARCHATATRKPPSGQTNNQGERRTLDTQDGAQGQHKPPSGLTKNPVRRHHGVYSSRFHCASCTEASRHQESSNFHLGRRRGTRRREHHRVRQRGGLKLRSTAGRSTLRAPVDVRGFLVAITASGSGINSYVKDENVNLRVGR